jgi:uncharacterized protein (TIGR00645 family)
MEKLLAKTLYATRYLLVPIYLGLSIALLSIALKFYQEIFHLIFHTFSMKESDLVLLVLSLIDMSLVAGLVIMVMLSGYANFVSKIDEYMPAWMGKLDASSLKIKVAASIVAISSIHLLKVFMNAEQIADNKIWLYIVLHMTFVVSAFIMSRK